MDRVNETTVPPDDIEDKDASLVASPSNNNATTTPSSASNTKLVKSKALSADAPVFYPKNFLNELSNLDSLTLNDDQQQQQNSSSNSAAAHEQSVLHELRNAIQMFTNDPGNFEQFMPSLARRLASMMSSGDGSFKTLIEEIFTQSIDEVNFRYTGARMCNYLSHSNEQAFHNFQIHFLSRCELEHEKIMTSQQQPSLSHVIGFSLFTGELLLNMKEVTSSRVIPQLPNQISQLLMYLLNNHSKEALMCTVQLLKLTGAVLEDNLPNLDDIFDKMNAIVNEQSLPQNVLCLMQSVMNQRLNRWGQHSSEPFIGAGAGDSFDSPIDENPINNMTDNELYNGNSFSSDEREMASLMEECNEQELLDQYWIGDQTMDNETATAFEQFMAESEIAARNLQQQQENHNNNTGINFNNSSNHNNNDNSSSNYMNYCNINRNNSNNNNSNYFNYFTSSCTSSDYNNRDRSQRDRNQRDSNNNSNNSSNNSSSSAFGNPRQFYNN